MISDELARAIDAFAQHPHVLVACDYDGTLAPIVDNPGHARPIRESIVAMRALAELHATDTAVISGRSLRDLAALSRMPDEVHLVGSHGSEFDVGFESDLSHEVRSHLATLVAALAIVAADFPGSMVESKPAGAAFHVRRVDAADRDRAVQAAIATAAPTSARIRHGKRVVEFSLVETDKGHALEALRDRLGADAVLFIGDDQTDEDAFAVLRGPDVSVKVGCGETTAAFRVDDPESVAHLLARVADRRSAWMSGGNAPPLEDLSVLANGSAIALVSPNGDLCWLCAPRPDSPSVFASIVGGDTAGYWRVEPLDGRRVNDQRYVGDTMTLETRWNGAVLTDTLVAPDPHRSTTRVVRRLLATTSMRVEFAPRGDFGRADPVWAIGDNSITARCGHLTLSLHAPGVEWTIEGHQTDSIAVASITADPATGAASEITFDLVIDHGGEEHPHGDVERGAQGDTDREWSAWADSLTTDDPIVRRSALTLRALCFQPTGAVLAAATTSLPEAIGGSRNWDYRFCWPRDAAHICRALVRVGSDREALAYLDWLAERVDALPNASHLRPLYPLDGDEYVPEAIIATLRGYRGSRPVRVGNLAEHQLQLDMFGPILDLIDGLHASTGTLDARHIALARSLVDAIVHRWSEPDHGIWEERRPPRHHVHSKAMCWMGIDRGLRLFTRLGRPEPAEWVEAQAAISAEILDRGWSSTRSSYAAAYGSDDIDASLLQLATCGLLPNNDERLAATVDAIQAALQDGVVVYRYHHDDGLPGREGGFLVCTAWLIEALHAIGRRRDAQVLYRRFVALAGPTGTMTEQFDPRTDIALGNVPQGYSHAGLIHAWAAIHGSTALATPPG